MFLGRNLQELTGNLFLSLSQELNTPVNGISSIIELLKVNIKNMDCRSPITIRFSQSIRPSS